MELRKLSKDKKHIHMDKISNEIICGLDSKVYENILTHASNKDNQVRKLVSTVLAGAHRDNSLKESLSKLFEEMGKSEDEKVRKTLILAAGEIGKRNAEDIFSILESGMNDRNEMVQKTAISVLKVMCEINPVPSLEFVSRLIEHENPAIRKGIVHGLELRGKKCPEDILPILRSVQNEKHKSVVNVIIHVVGRISYKKGSIEKVVEELKTWTNKWLVKKSAQEIISFHKKHTKFANRTPEEITDYLCENGVYEK